MPGVCMTCSGAAVPCLPSVCHPDATHRRPGAGPQAGAPGPPGRNGHRASRITDPIPFDAPTICRLHSLPQRDRRLLPKETGEFHVFNLMQKLIRATFSLPGWHGPHDVRRVYALLIQRRVMLFRDGSSQPLWSYDGRVRFQRSEQGRWSYSGGGHFDRSVLLMQALLPAPPVSGCPGRA